MNDETQSTAAVPETVPLNIVPLDDAALAALAEIAQQERDIAHEFAGQRVGVVRLVMRQQKLDGVWGLSDDRRSIVRRQ